MEEVASNRCFDGRQVQYRHRAESLGCDMNFSVYLPPQAASRRVPVVYWLSGLTCTDQNFVTKAGAQAHAARLGLAIVCPDTSPRGDDVPDDPDGAYDFGLGAGFYVNATEAPWSTHYHMYDYVTKELPAALAPLPLDVDRAAISGHSMGGHGALVMALRGDASFASASAFAPIASPMTCPWGHKAFGNYLGTNEQDWAQYDASALLRDGRTGPPMLVDQGDADDFLTEQLQPEALVDAARQAGASLELRMQPGYDHSYFFIATFIGEHLEFHAQHLG